MTTLQALLGIEHPLIQAPLAGVQDHGLAAAVSNAGALGSLPCAMLAAPALQSELEKLQAATDRPYNVNFFAHTNPVPDPSREAAWRQALAPYYAQFDIDPASIGAGPGRQPFSAESAELLARFKPKVVSFHFGLPAPEAMQRIRDWGGRIIASATTVAEARWLAERSVDAVIAQGVEAGGHRGIFLSDDLTTQVGLFSLLPQIVQAVSVPVIAAGGIADANGVAAAMALGAAGVQVGTAYMLCPEATTSAVHRAALKSEGAVHTALTNLFTGRPARGIVNRVIRELGPISAAAPAFPLATAAIAPLRAKAEAQGSGEFTSLWAGQNVSGCREIAAAELTATLLEGLYRHR
ncbi:NAD(P)H-dependent flavin oxidoreductase [Herbaspirillum sp. alder98]|uniref:NAD(P)H-dependent flavin oxidoreductase n=1 Tax=Herbaspirillum sp. alder98 TaxID=2913096 RepID=UPI001CD84DAA|nr:nitronate monooxygenase [Herbaspirillum sp. alder98]MCA1322688.1 nitronate monooxygenase [Herbaspirillum sp. alder98]